MRTKLKEGSRPKDANLASRSGLHFFPVEDSRSVLTYTDLLQEAGEFGTFQRRLVALTFLPNILSAYFIYVRAVVLGKMPHYCNTTWLLAIQPNLTTLQLFNLTVPRQADGSFEECLMYSPVQWDYDSIVKYGLNETKPCQNGWVYASMGELSPVNEFDLVCDKASERLIAMSFFVVGLLFGSLISGTLCDRIGRYKTILLMLLLFAVFGFGTAFVPNFTVFKTFQFATGIAISGYAISSVCLVTEWLVLSRRAQAILLAHSFFAIGLAMVSFLAYFIAHWRLLYVAGGAPAIFLISYIWILPESPRWLIMRGKIEKAKLVLRTAASINQRIIPQNLLRQLSCEEDTPYGTVLDILQNHKLRKITMILVYVWFSISCCYFSLTNHVKRLKMNTQGSYLAFPLAEVPSRFLCITFVEKLGRKTTLSFTLYVAGFACLTSAFISKDLFSIDVTLSLMGHVGMAAAVTVSFIYSVEIFPSVLSIGIISTPLIVGLENSEPKALMTGFSVRPKPTSQQQNLLVPAEFRVSMGQTSRAGAPFQGFRFGQDGEGQRPGAAPMGDPLETADVPDSGRPLQARQDNVSLDQIRTRVWDC
ncbi:solute carrier family 22 member 14-like [Gracilinanus agilis]|uniref:solute carrier family 22 member 14-like n=1 Tax=Gracilinanus agilis TaxID=191870 RepID=UPI001CFEDD57|nr:solute carrier family 22 member 14-like [Gracilinanus agilis]